MNNRKGILILIFMLSISLVACDRSKNKKLEETIDDIFLSIKEQDMDGLKEYMPELYRDNINLDDEEYIAQFSDEIRWRVKNIDEVDGKYVANILLNTVDVDSFHKDRNEKISYREEDEDIRKKNVELSLSFKKISDEYVMIYDEYTYRDIVKAIVGKD